MAACDCDDLRFGLERFRLALAFKGIAIIVPLGLPAAGPLGVGRAGVFQAAERIAVARVDVEDALVGFLRLARLAERHVSLGQLVQDRLIRRLALGQRLVGEGLEGGKPERNAGVADQLVGLGVERVVREHLLGEGQLLGRLLFAGVGKLDRRAGDLHVHHLLLEL